MSLHHFDPFFNMHKSAIAAGFARRCGRAGRHFDACPFSCIKIIPLKSAPDLTALCITPKPCKSETLSFHRLDSPAQSFICSHGRRNDSNLREYTLGGIVTLPTLEIGRNRSNLPSPDLVLPSPCKGVTVTRIFTVTRLDQHGESGFGISGAGRINNFDEEQASIFTVTRYVIVQFDDTISVATT